MTTKRMYAKDKPSVTIRHEKSDTESKAMLTTLIEEASHIARSALDRKSMILSHPRNLDFKIIAEMRCNGFQITGGCF